MEGWTGHTAESAPKLSGAFPILHLGHHGRRRERLWWSGQAALQKSSRDDGETAQPRDRLTQQLMLFGHSGRARLVGPGRHQVSAVHAQRRDAAKVCIAYLPDDGFRVAKKAVLFDLVKEEIDRRLRGRKGLGRRLETHLSGLKFRGSCHVVENL